MKMDLSPLIISLKTAIVSTTVTLLLGVLLCGRMREAKRTTAWLVDTVLTLPLVLPPTVLGFFMLLTLGKNSPTGQLLAKMDIQIVFSWYANVLAAILVSLPLMYQAVKGAMSKVDQEQIWAARTLGMRERAIFLQIILPQSAPGILSGVILSFTRALGEFGATMMVAGNIPGRTQSMSLAVYFATAAGNMKLAAFWTAVITALSCVILGMMNRMGGKSRDAGSFS